MIAGTVRPFHLAICLVPMMRCRARTGETMIQEQEVPRSPPHMVLVHSFAYYLLPTYARSLETRNTMRAHCLQRFLCHTKHLTRIRALSQEANHLVATSLVNGVRQKFRHHVFRNALLIVLHRCRRYRMSTVPT